MHGFNEALVLILIAIPQLVNCGGGGIRPSKWSNQDNIPPPPPLWASEMVTIPPPPPPLASDIQPRPSSKNSGTSAPKDGEQENRDTAVSLWHTFLQSHTVPSASKAWTPKEDYSLCLYLADHQCRIERESIQSALIPKFADGPERSLEQYFKRLRHFRSFICTHQPGKSTQSWILLDPEQVDISSFFLVGSFRPSRPIPWSSEEEVLLESFVRQYYCHLPLTKVPEFAQSFKKRSLNSVELKLIHTRMNLCTRIEDGQWVWAKDVTEAKAQTEGAGMSVSAKRLSSAISVPDDLDKVLADHFHLPASYPTTSNLQDLQAFNRPVDTDSIPGLDIDFATLDNMPLEHIFRDFDELGEDGPNIVPTQPKSSSANQKGSKASAPQVLAPSASWKKTSTATVNERRSWSTVTTQMLRDYLIRNKCRITLTECRAFGARIDRTDKAVQGKAATLLKKMCNSDGTLKDPSESPMYSEDYDPNRAVSELTHAGNTIFDPQGGDIPVSPMEVNQSAPDKPLNKPQPYFWPPEQVKIIRDILIRKKCQLNVSEITALSVELGRTYASINLKLKFERQKVCHKISATYGGWAVNDEYKDEAEDDTSPGYDLEARTSEWTEFLNTDFPVAHSVTWGHVEDRMLMEHIVEHRCSIGTLELSELSARLDKNPSRHSIYSRIRHLRDMMCKKKSSTHFELQPPAFYLAFIKKSDQVQEIDEDHLLPIAEKRYYWSPEDVDVMTALIKESQCALSSKELRELSLRFKRTLSSTVIQMNRLRKEICIKDEEGNWRMKRGRKDQAPAQDGVSQGEKRRIGEGNVKRLAEDAQPVKRARTKEVKSKQQRSKENMDEDVFDNTDDEEEASFGSDETTSMEEEDDVNWSGSALESE